jgi:hypothetical protein
LGDVPDEEMLEQQRGLDGVHDEEMQEQQNKIYLSTSKPHNGDPKNSNSIKTYSYYFIYFKFHKN